MQRKIIKAISAALVFVTLLSVSLVSASAKGRDPFGAISTGLDEDGRKYKWLSSVTNKNVWSYTRPVVTVGGKGSSVNGIIIGGVAYIPFRAAASLISGSTYSYDSSTRTSTMRAGGLEIVAGDGCYVTYANGRVLFSSTPNVIMSDGRIYIPASVFAKAVGMSYTATDSRIDLTGQYSPILSGDRFYRSDEVFWLARIIHAESRGEPLIGQIAVGNVVLNRVKSNYYPNTIYGVIFDRKYGVQFSPILDGSIYNTPGYSATLAAKICLEGYNLSEGSFFFLNTALATSSWIPRTREYAFTIGNHDFYK